MWRDRRGREREKADQRERAAKLATDPTHSHLQKTMADLAVDSVVLTRGDTLVNVSVENLNVSSRVFVG